MADNYSKPVRGEQDQTWFWNVMAHQWQKRNLPIGEYRGTRGSKGGSRRGSHPRDGHSRSRDGDGRGAAHRSSEERHHGRGQASRPDQSGADFPPEVARERKQESGVEADRRGGGLKRAHGDDEELESARSNMPEEWEPYANSGTTVADRRFCEYCKRWGHTQGWCWDRAPSRKGSGKQRRRDAAYLDAKARSSWEPKRREASPTPVRDPPEDTKEEVESEPEEPDGGMVEPAEEKGKVNKKKLRDQQRSEQKIAEQLAAHRSGEAKQKFRPCHDPDERLVRRACARFFGSDGDDDIEMVATRLGTITATVGGVVTNECLFKAQVGLKLSKDEYRDMEGTERVKMSVSMTTEAEIDLPKKEYEKDPTMFLAKLTEKFSHAISYVLPRVQGILEGYHKGASVSELRLQFNDPNAVADKVKAMAVSPEETAARLKEIEALNARLLADKAAGEEVGGDDDSTKGGTVTGRASSVDEKSEPSCPGLDLVDVTGDEKETNLEPTMKPELLVDLEPSEGSKASSGAGSASLPAEPSGPEVSVGPNPREAASMTKAQKGSPNRDIGYGPLHGRPALDVSKAGATTKVLGELKFVYDCQEAGSQPVLGMFLYPEISRRRLVGFIDWAPVVDYWPSEEGRDKKGTVIQKFVHGPVSAATSSSKSRKAKGEKPYERACLPEGSLFVDPAMPGQSRDARLEVIKYGDPTQFEKLKESMAANELAKLAPRRYERLISVHRGGVTPPVMSPAVLKQMVQECLLLELVYYKLNQFSRREFTWYVRCTCCRVAFQMWSTCECGQEIEHLRQRDWRAMAAADSSVATHLQSSEHVILFSEYGERLTAPMGHCRPGMGQRHMRQSPVVNKSWYTYHGYRVDSPATEAAPLPTKEAIHDTMGRPEGLIPMVWEAARLRKISLHVMSPVEGDLFVNIGMDDIKALHAGVVYWGMHQLGSQYVNNGTQMPCIYADMGRLPATNDEYFDTFLGVRPSKGSEHPELALLERAMKKVHAVKNTAPSVSKKSKSDPPWDEPPLTTEELAAYQLPPATTLQSWYPVVRIELKNTSRVRAVDVNVCPVCCMVQIVNLEAETMTAWNLSIAEHTVTDAVAKAAAKFSAGGLCAQVDMVE